MNKADKEEEWTSRVHLLLFFFFCFKSRSITTCVLILPRERIDPLKFR